MSVLVVAKGNGFFLDVISARNNVVVSGSNSSITCVNNNNGNPKGTNNGVRQIATAVSKTVVRKQSRDPRLVDPRTADKFQNVDAKKVNESGEYIQKVSTGKEGIIDEGSRSSS